VPLFEIYRKHLRVEPREVGKPLLDMGEKFVTVGSYSVTIPPVDNVPGELAAALDILPPLVVISGGFGIVVVDHDTKHPILHLVPFQEAIDGVLFGLVQLKNNLVQEVGPVLPCNPIRGLQEVVVIAGEVSV
jgi:hypothetical protein